MTNHSISTPQGRNTAIGQGYGVAAAAAAVVLVITVMFALAWLSFLSPKPSSSDIGDLLASFANQFGLRGPDAPGGCEAFAEDTGLTATPTPISAAPYRDQPTSSPSASVAPCLTTAPPSALGLLATFGAIAIASVVAVGSAVRELEKLRERTPSSDRRDYGPPRSQFPQPEPDSGASWYTRRATAQVVTFAELVMLILVTGFAVLTTSALIAIGTPGLAGVSACLTIFLWIEATRFLLAVAAISDVHIEPLPELIAERLNKLALQSAWRTTLAACRGASWISTCAAMSVVFVAGTGSVQGISVTAVFAAITLVFMKIVRSFVRSAITETGSSRFSTIAAAAVGAMIVISLVWGIGLVSLVPAPGHLANVGAWALVIGLVLVFASVLDAAGIPAQWSMALRRGESANDQNAFRRGGTGGPTIRRAYCWFFLLGVSALSSAPFGLGHPGAIAAPIFLFVALAGLALLMERNRWIKIMVSTFVVSGLSITALTAPEPSVTMWAAYALLPALALAFSGTRPTRSGLLLRGLFRGHADARRRRESARWTNQLKGAGIVERLDVAPRFRAALKDSMSKSEQARPHARSLHPHLLNEPA